MSTSKRSSVLRYVAAALSVFASCGPATQDVAESPSTSPESPAAETGTLVVHAPEDRVVLIDGEAHQREALSNLTLPVGEHRVTLVETECERELSQTVVVRDATEITLESSPRVIAYEVSVIHAGAPHAAEVFVEGARSMSLEASAGPKAVEVPACAADLEIRSEGLGGIYERLDRTASSPQTRAVVLRPGPSMVRIEGGTFMMGSANPEDQAGPVHEAGVETFWMDRSEVTRADFQACVDAGRCTWEGANRGGTEHQSRRCVVHSPDHSSYPVNCVNQTDAETYCEFAGKRLPTAAEWEFAARSRGRHPRYPWGEEPMSCEHALWDYGLDCGGAPQAVCTRPKGMSEQGLCDLVGNVAESTSSVGRDLDGRVDDSRFDSRGTASAVSSFGVTRESRSIIGGFRCVVDA